MLTSLLKPILFATIAIAAPALQTTHGHHLNCTFTIHLTETCKFTTTADISTSARLPTILSPWGNDITNSTSALDIDDKPLTIYAHDSQEDIAGRLDIERPNNTKVEFQWTYGPSGGRPVTEKWDEEKEGKDGRYGCVVQQDWNFPGKECDAAQPTEEREKFLHCWFKCNGVADPET